MKEYESRMTSKGQVTIPAELRERLGLKPHDSVRISEERGIITIYPVESVLLTGYGAAKSPRRYESAEEERAEIEAIIAADARARGGG